MCLWSSGHDIESDVSKSKKKRNILILNFARNLLVAVTITEVDNSDTVVKFSPAKYH